MNKKSDRFQVVYSQGTLEMYRILVDKETGVNYLYISNGSAGGLTPLLDKEGRPIITPYNS
ncbi:MAG: xylan 1,4-beta-xylosidase [Clostridiales bacterium]|uniref:DUF6440 family protein n=1 Tax=Clostridium sp. N3C TaxID=1776758 RepID=UPI00092DF4B0|nr:DUF6440 family protein [Clostridium sp. N3C]NLZ49411.1 xylan 1,4-beta-xylosidase [Clostridiales bacterium]SCN23374.1 hypothetical protein N3C_1272 [Clostridium sp. N3C]